MFGKEKGNKKSSVMTAIVLASGNPGKLRELQKTLGVKGLEFVAQAQFNITEADETGLSFVENAIIKARHASQCTGLAAIADDSGIEVDALNGEPGIYSARYYSMCQGLNEASDDEMNNQMLLQAMNGVPEDKRSARFQCVIAYMRHPKDPTPLICQGSWEGRILFQNTGKNGFGYDSLFYVPSHKCSSAELDPEVKNQLSHRGQAIRQLLKRWR